MRKYDAAPPPAPSFLRPTRPRRSPRCQLEENSFLLFAIQSARLACLASLLISSLLFSPRRSSPLFLPRVLTTPSVFLLLRRGRGNPVGYSDENRNAIGM